MSNFSSDSTTSTLPAALARPGRRSSDSMASRAPDRRSRAESRRRARARRWRPVSGPTGSNWRPTPRTDRSRPSSATFWRITAAVGKCCSMMVARAAPRLSASNASAPVPANRSIACLPDRVRAEQVEDRLADAILHRPGARLRAAVQQLAAAQRPADDARRAAVSGGASAAGVGRGNFERLFACVPRGASR